MPRFCASLFFELVANTSTFLDETALDTVVRVFPLTLLVILPAAPLTAQTSDLRGIVVDSASGDRIPFATVTVSELNRGGATNINGFYLFTGVPSGAYDVTAGSVGYHRTTKRVIVREGEASVLNFELVPQPVEFSEVVVTERSRRELSEINTSVHVLDVKDIKVIPIALQPDVFRAIQVLPGIVSTSDVNTHFYVRGGAGDQNLILLDGMKVYNPFHAFGIFSSFDADVIKTTEVYTGAFPPGYGGRLSSVVNMITRDGNRKEFGGRADINLVSSKLQLEGPVSNDLRFLVSGRTSTFTQTLDRVLRKNMPLSFYDAFLKVTGEDMEDHSRYGFTGFFSGDRLKTRSLQSPDYTWKNHAIGFTGGGLVEERLFVDVVAFENSFEAFRDPKQSSATPASTSIRETGIRANATQYLDSKDLFFFGFEFTFPNLSYSLINNVGTPITLATSYVDFWTWVRYQATVGSLQIDGGLHIDVGSVFQRSAGLEVLEPRLNASYLFTPTWRAKLSYGRFSQHVVTVNNEDDVIAVFDAWISVPEEIGAERADHYVAGVEGNILPQLSVSIQSYYKYYSSLVAYNRDKIEPNDPDYIRGTGQASGFEFLLRYGIPWCALYGTYTLGWTTVTNGSLTYPPRFDRRHSVNLLSVFHVAEKVDASFRWEFGSGFPYTQSIGYYDRLSLDDPVSDPLIDENGTPFVRLGDKNAARLPSYHRLDMSLTYRFDLGGIRGNAGLHIVNVYDRRNIFYFDRMTGELVHQLPFFPSFNLTVEY